MQVGVHRCYKLGICFYVKCCELFLGRILEDASILNDHGIDEKKFIVIMVTKPKAVEPAQPATPAEPTPAPTPAAQPTPTPAPPAAAAPPSRQDSGGSGYHCMLCLFNE